jgi:hypothetical protein
MNIHKQLMYMRRGCEVMMMMNMTASDEIGMKTHERQV